MHEVDGAADVGQLVGAHPGVTDEDDRPGRVDFLQQLGGRLALAVVDVVEDVFVRAVVKEAALEGLEMARRMRGGEELLAEHGVRIHRATDIHQ